MSDAWLGRVRFREHRTFYSFLMADKDERWQSAITGLDMSV